MLHEACANGHAPLIKLLIARGGNIEDRNTVGMTCLHLAAYNAHIEATRVLLEAGATQHARDRDGSDVMYTVHRQIMVAKTARLEQRNKKDRLKKIQHILEAELRTTKFSNTPWSLHERVVA